MPESTMRAVCCRRYGAPKDLRVEEMPIPEPGPGEVRVRVEASSLNAGDWRLVRGQPFVVRLMFGLRRPRHPVLGSDVAGVVEAVGEGVKTPLPGERVLGDLSTSGFGAHAERVVAPAEALCTFPETWSFARAAATPLAAVTALQGLRDGGGCRAGMRVFVQGATGGVGSFAVQIARALGAEVEASASAAKAEFVRALGATEVHVVGEATLPKERYDLFLDAAAFRPLGESLRSLVPGGTYVMAGGPFGRFLKVSALGGAIGRLRRRRLRPFLARPSLADLGEVRAWIDSGAVRPRIDRAFSLEELPQALAYLEERHARGKVVIAVGPDGRPGEEDLAAPSP